MEKQPIGLIIKSIIQQKNLSPTRLAGELGISKQQVYNTYMRTNLNELEIQKWADAMKVSVEELQNFKFGSNATNDSSDSDVLNSIRKMLEDELKEKNEQIRALQKALEQSQMMQSVLLGKSPEHSDAEVLPQWTIIINGADAIERPLWPDGIQHATA